MLQLLICAGVRGAVRGGGLGCAVPAGKLRLGPAHGTYQWPGGHQPGRSGTGSSCKHGHQ